MTAPKELRFSLNFDTLKIRGDAQRIADKEHRGNLTAYIHALLLEDHRRRNKKTKDK